MHDAAAILQRMMQAAGATTQTELALLLEIGKAAISDAKRRNIVPAEWFLKLCREPYRISPLWLESGEEPMRIPADGASPVMAESGALYGDGGGTASAPEDAAYVAVPLALPRLDQEHSLAAAPAAPRCLFLRTWLQERGEPGRMKLLRIMGDAMQPSLRDGDVALLDESQTDVFEGGIYVLGMDGQVVVRRLAKRLGSVLLISENRELYDPQEVPFPSQGLAVLGRVVWYSREL